MNRLQQLFRDSLKPTADVPAASGQVDHYLGLDLLRGVAALAVVWFHCSTRLDLPYLFHHGYLAVDFFFALSGFVLARAYHARIASRRLALPRFALMRVIRLMPLIVLGTLLAAVIEIGRPGIADQHRHLVDAALALLSGSLLLPTLGTTTLEFTTFPLNGPTWSLFLEAVASAAFAAWARLALGVPALVAVLATSALALLWGGARYGEIGFGAVPDTFWLGFARVAWSFTVGMVLFRVRGRAPRLPFALPALLLVAIMLAPPLGSLNAVFDLASTFVLLPLVVWAASTAHFGRLGRRWSAWSGDLSYPIYAIHYPLVRLLGAVGTKLHLSVMGRLGFALLTTVVILVASAVAYALFDVPIRRWLTARTVRPS